MTITTLVLGIFGAFFRWLQLLNAFEADSGLAIPGSATSAALVVYLLAAAAVIGVLMFLWLRRYEKSGDAAVALRTSSVLPTVLCWVLGVVMVLAALSLMFSAGAARTPTLQRVFAALAILAGVSLPFIYGRKGETGANPLGSVASLVPVLMSCFWLVFSYKVNSEDPVVWGYAVEVLAIAATTLAFYYVAAYHYGRARPDRAIFTVQLAALLDFTTLADKRSTALTLIFAACALWMLLTQFLLISDLEEKQPTGENKAEEA